MLITMSRWGSGLAGILTRPPRGSTDTTKYQEVASDG
jgi:hypothetical protein